MTNNELAENKDFREKVGNLVDELVKMENKDKGKISEENCIVVQLRKINKEILNHKIIADQYTIYPIWVEAYYYNKGVFDDMSCHINNTEDIRGNVPGQFEFRKHKVGYGGVDLYLGKPNGDYLSFLIKLALIKEEGKDAKLCSQVQIKDELIDYLDKEILTGKLGTYLDWLEKNNKLVECVSDKNLKEVLNNYFSNRETKESLKKYLLDTVGQKTELVFSSYLNTSKQIVENCTRVGLKNEKNEKYNVLKLASYILKGEQINTKSSRKIYNELKERNDLYLMED